MPKNKDLKDSIFAINNEEAFNKAAVEVFRYQYKNNAVYRRYVDCLNRKLEAVEHYTRIPFLPIEFFKTRDVVTGEFVPEAVFTSSGTTGMSFSRHQVKELSVYERSFMKGFELFFGPADDYVFVSLLPSYLERKGSSLIYMAERLIKLSRYNESGFYLNEYRQLSDLLKALAKQKKKTILLGVTYALLDLAEEFPVNFPELIIMETGGMKGKRKEMVREELHGILKSAFGVKKIFSEYGMTELLSQAYSKGDGLFATPPWMKVLIRDTNDPFSLMAQNKTGGVNVIDLANINSCSFIETKDLGKLHDDGQFEIVGRFDNSDVRGCNLLVG